MMPTTTPIPRPTTRPRIQNKISILCDTPPCKKLAREDGAAATWPILLCLMKMYDRVQGSPRGELSPQATEGWKVGYWGVPIISNISRAFSAHPSDPAAPGHLPSKGRLGVLRHSESDSPDYNFTQRKRPGAQIAIHSRPKCRIYSNAAGARPGQHTIPYAILLSDCILVKHNCAITVPFPRKLCDSRQRKRFFGDRKTGRVVVK